MRVLEILVNLQEKWAGFWAHLPWWLKASQKYQPRRQLVDLTGCSNTDHFAKFRRFVAKYPLEFI